MKRPARAATPANTPASLTAATGGVGPLPWLIVAGISGITYGVTMGYAAAKTNKQDCD